MPGPFRQGILKYGVGLLLLAACSTAQTSPPEDEAPVQTPAAPPVSAELLEATAGMVSEMAAHLYPGTRVVLAEPENKTSQPGRRLNDQVAQIAAGLNAGGMGHELLFVEAPGEEGADYVLRIVFYDPRSGAPEAWFLSLRLERGDEAVWRGSYEARFAPP
ncbi:MAG: hypothetical protein ACE10D_04650 [Planctomycetota bacterium]|nr:hypothetical protein [Planctomycetota bacterium]